jgi:toxin-antitoxin system PIN domain toxin
MILIDVNLLLYAYNASAPEHPAARRWLQETFSKPQPVLLPWATILGFLRIATSHRIWAEPLSIAEAVDIVDSWLALPNVTVTQPGERHWSILKQLLPDSQSRGALVPDAHLAALAIEHGAGLCTNDRDFARYRGIRVTNPLEA